MHEWALAEGVISTALNASEQAGLKQITKIAVSLGQLQQIDPGIFAHLLQDVIPATEPRLAGTWLSPICPR